MFRGLRGAGCLYRRVVELHGTAHELQRAAAVGGFHLEEHVIGERLFVAGKVEQALHGRPLTLSVSNATPVGEGALGEGLGDEIARGLGILDERSSLAEARVLGSLWKP